MSSCIPYYPYSFFNTHLGIKTYLGATSNFLKFLIPKWVLKSPRVRFISASVSDSETPKL